MKKIKRIAEVLDTSGGCCHMTGKGAVFIGEKECAKALADLKRLDAGEAARFAVDWEDQDGNILDTFGVDEKGFRSLLGEDPQEPEAYAEYDRQYWADLRTRMEH